MTNFIKIKAKVKEKKATINKSILAFTAFNIPPNAKIWVPQDSAQKVVYKALFLLFLLVKNKDFIKEKLKNQACLLGPIAYLGLSFG